jgi:outer membrane protein W
MRKVLSRALLPVFVVASQLSATTPVVAGDEEKDGSPPVAEEKQAESGKSRERKWRMRLIGAVAGDNNGVLVTSGHYPHAGVSINGGGGVGINFEYRYSPWMGFEVGAMAVGSTVSVGAGKKSRSYGAGVEVNGYLPVTFAFNYHPLKNPEIVDFYVGPLAAFTLLSAVAVGPGVYVESYADLGLGANLGVDINFGKHSRWSFNTGFKYISNVTSREDRETQLELDPLLFTFGFGFKF